MSAAKPMALPWRGEWVPHALLDLGRPCNISCAGCYNGRSGGFKPLSQVAADLEQITRVRRLQAISLVGGEPSLHPHLVEIVRLAARHNRKVALLTNGVTLQADALQRLREAGLSIVLLHIEPGQERPELPATAAPARWQQLRAAKAALVARAGIAVGLSHIARRTHADETERIIHEVLTSDTLDFLLITGFRDFTRFHGVTGTVAQGLRMAADASACHGVHIDEVTMRDLLPIMARMRLSPFAFVGSDREKRAARWLIYLAVAGTADDAGPSWCTVLPGASDRLFSRALRWVFGRNVFLHLPTRAQFRWQLRLNAWTGGGGGAARLAAQLTRNGQTVRDKHIVLQEGPARHPDGTIETCCDCPDAVWQNGALVPVCLADRFVGVGCTLFGHPTPKETPARPVPIVV